MNKDIRGYLILALLLALMIIVAFGLVNYHTNRITETDQKNEARVQFYSLIAAVSLTLFIFSLERIYQEQVGIKMAKELNEENHKEQQRKLKSLEVFLLAISRCKSRHLDLLKKGEVPTEFIPELNAPYYILELDSKLTIMKKDVDTMHIKELLLMVESKIKEINRILELVQNAELIGKLPIKKRLFSELKDKNHYSELERFSQELRKEWMNLDGYRN